MIITLISLHVYVIRTQDLYPFFSLNKNNPNRFDLHYLNNPLQTFGSKNLIRRLIYDPNSNSNKNNTVQYIPLFSYNNTIPWIGVIEDYEQKQHQTVSVCN
jgi:hypothetical protein